MTPEEADYLLDEWGRWARGDNTLSKIGYADRSPYWTPGGVLPAVEPVDPDRAYRTDRAVASLSGRRRFIVKLSYLDTSPRYAKARRLRLSREQYRVLVRGLCAMMAVRLDSCRELV
jgi:hypothetical protein